MSDKEKNISGPKNPGDIIPPQNLTPNISSTPTSRSAKTAQHEQLLSRVKPLFPRTGHLMQAFLDAYEKTENQSLAGKEVGVGHDAVAEVRLHNGLFSVHTDAVLRDVPKTDLIIIPAMGGDMATAIKKNEDFMALFTASHIRAQRKNNDNLKSSALQRAINGNAHFVIDKVTGLPRRDENNQPIVSYRDFETQLTMFMLKNRMPDEFRDKFEHEISGQIIMTLTSEFSAILKKHVPVQFMPAITKDLETLSAKMGATQ